MKKSTKNIIKLAALFVVIVGVSVVSWKLMDYHKGAQDYADAAQIAGIAKPPVEADPQSPSSADRDSTPPPQEADPADPAQPAPTPTPDPYAQELAKVDLDALRQVNPEVMGWIAIPGTDVFYPMLHTDNNQHYLNYTWKNENSGVGAIFLETMCQPDFSDFNTIIYGHQMMDGSMFGGLQRYADQSYADQHPNIYIARDGVVEKYQVFAAFEVGVRELIYRLDLEETGRQQELVDFCKERSTIQMDAEMTGEGKMITLSTCTGWGYATRWVVTAALVE